MVIASLRLEEVERIAENLDHPEGICVVGGSIYVGGEAGQLYRIDEAGDVVEVLTTGGWLLGLAADARGMIYACDAGHSCVWILDPTRARSRVLTRGTRDEGLAVPNWLAFADDVQGLYPEPADYAAMIARLEAHLQQHPFDRDAWTLLGTQWLLSGRRKLAADAFLRLTDRPPDALLERLLIASGARP